MKTRIWILTGMLAALAFLTAGCAGDPSSDPFVIDDNCGIEGKEGEEKASLCDVPDEGKEDNITGARGLSTAVDGSDTAVWEVKNAWDGTDAAAGIAWSANSGLTWDQKYDRWVQSMVKIPGASYYETFELSTPWGKTIQAPLLECAEVAIFLRVTFASWYNLPFFLEATDGSGNRLYFGHFGARTANGRYGNTPRFKASYKDYTSSYSGGNWPQDASLRGRKIGGTASDIQTFLGADVHAGAYFDEIFLNKRVGYFLCLTLAYFGSINLASGSNTYHVKPENIKAGDLLIERWQKRGIGHVMVIKKVEPLDAGHIEAEIVSGSMPRRQPKWESAAASKHYFTMEECGGPGENYDGDEYAKLGGGVRRFRAAKAVSGQWTNVVLDQHRDQWISDRDYAAIAARPATFDEILGEVSPEQKREVLVRAIEDARMHLRQYPASCSARTRREDAFTELYVLNQESFGMNKADSDHQYRKLEDYVFAELVYEQSKTCCWNSSTAAMYDIVMAYNEAYVNDNGACRAPMTFMARDAGGADDGYQLFKAYADSIGRGNEWVAWSEDESCPQSGTVNDTEEAHESIGYCEFASTSAGNCPDAYDGNNSMATAPLLGAGTYAGLKVCDDVPDWFAVDAADGANVTVTITFSHASGDLDMEAWSTDASVARSNTTSDTEKVTFTMSGDRWIKVLGYQGDANTYSMTIEIEGGGQTNDPCPDPFSGNDSQAQAAAIAAGTYTGLQVCGGTSDWFLLSAAAGSSATVTIEFVHADGDLDMEAFDGANEVAASESTANSESVQLDLSSDKAIRVFGYNSANNTYSLTVDIQ